MNVLMKGRLKMDFHSKSKIYIFICTS